MASKFCKEIEKSKGPSIIRITPNICIDGYERLLKKHHGTVEVNMAARGIAKEVTEADNILDDVFLEITEEDMKTRTGEIN